VGCFVADFPNAVVRLLPFLHHRLDHVFHHFPHFLNFVQCAREILVVLIDDIHEVAEGVVLFLTVSVVADAHRLGALETTQVGQGRFSQCSFPPDTIHDLKPFVLAFEDGVDEIHEAAGGPLVPQRQQGLYGHGGISQPAETIIPVPDFAQGLW